MQVIAGEICDENHINSIDDSQCDYRDTDASVSLVKLIAN